MIITKKAISRRTVLRGIGTTLALPLLDSMVPALGAASASAPKRFGAVYVPNGMLMKHLTPAAEGSGFEITPILEPLRSFREQLLFFSGLSNKEANAYPGEGTGDHARASSAFLTGLHAVKRESSPELTAASGDVGVGMSLDQLVARKYAHETQLPSLELGLEPHVSAGSCDPNFACIYDRTISWRSTTLANPTEHNPRMVFERLFGASGTTDPVVLSSRRRKDRSILDSVLDKIADLGTAVGSADKARLSEYTEAVRDIERRIQLAEEQSDRELPTVEQPTGVPDTFEKHIKLMFDLQALALETDLTRVFTFVVASELSPRPYPEIGVPDPHHALTHDVVSPGPIEGVTKINVFHVQMFAYFLEKLKAIQDGDGTLLDHSAIVYGSGMSHGNVHSHENLPIVLVGGLGGQIRGGRHLVSPPGTPASNLHLALAEKYGVEVDTFGDATGRVSL